MNRVSITWGALTLLIICSGAFAGANIQKTAPILATKTFDPAAPPKEMPPLSEHEIALTDAVFSAGVSTERRTPQPTNDDGFEVTLNLQYIHVVGRAADYDLGSQGRH